MITHNLLLKNNWLKKISDTNKKKYKPRIVNYKKKILDNSG